MTNTAPDGSYTVSAYSYGRPSSVTRRDSLNNQLSSTSYSYDSHGRQSAVTDARNGTTSYAYNSADLVSSVSTPNPGTIGGSAQTTTTSYDASIRAWKITQPDNTTVTNEFDLAGQLKRAYGSHTYPVGYSYYSQGRMKTMTNWTSLADDSGKRVTTWNYDAYRGWLASKTYDGGAAGPNYTYSAAGRLQTRVWARSITTAYGYNNSGDLSSVTYSDSTPGATNTFDRLGRQKTIVCSGITNTPAYNTANEVLSETFSGGILNGLAVTNAYDTYLRRTAVGLNTQPSTLNQFGYDTASRLQGVTNGNYNAAYGYLANSPLVSQITFRTNTTTRMTTTKTYDFLNRLTAISSVPSGAGILPVSFTYAYNSANQRTRASLSDGSYWLYEYDSLGQVRSGKKYWADGTPVTGQQFEYGFDDIGNRKTTKAGGDENGWNLRSANYGANSLNQYTNRDVPGYVDIMGLSFATNSVTVNSQTAYRKGEYFRKELAVGNSSASLWTNMIVAATGQTSVTGNVFVAKTPETFSYDADGNLTSDGRWTNRWDGENRLVGMETLSSVPTGGKKALGFTYDARSRRQSLVVSNWSGSAWTNVTAQTRRFVFDGWNLLATLDGNNALVQSFVWGLDLSGSSQGDGGVGGLLAVNDAANGFHFAAYDGNGNVLTLVKSTDGTVSANYEYGPFGEVLRATGSLAKANPFRFSTKYQDNDTDLLYYGFRFFNPSTGRWLCRDPKEEKGGLNIYGFLANAPVAEFDWLGLCGGGDGDDTECSCGPDVTYTVKRTIFNIIWEFNKTKLDKKKACNNILKNINSSHNWDVLWLLHASTSGVAKCQKCALTYTFEAKCFQQYSLWYFLYGTAAKLCDAEYPQFYTGPYEPIFTLTQGLIARAPISGDTPKQVADKVAVAKHFFKGTPLPADDAPGCPHATGKPPKDRLDSRNWRWRGIKWIKDTDDEP